MKKMKLIAITAIMILAGTFFLTNEDIAKADINKETVIKEGVYIGGIDVSGMTAEEATAAVDAYVAELQEVWITLVGAKNTLRYQLKDLGLSSKTEVAVKEAVAVGNSGNLIKRFKSLEDLKKENYVVDMGLSIDKQLTGNKIHGKRGKIDIKAIDNGLKKENGKLVYSPGQEGNEVDIVPSVNALNEYIATEWEIAPIEKARFELTSVVSQPRGTEEEVSKIKDVLGFYTTNYNFSDDSRRANVETGTSKINGAILYPGDEFSFYEYVTPFTEENGYAVSFSYENGDTVTSVGGGICQVVTTLYNAILNAELKITQRFAHSMVVGYVDPGADAAISGTYKDLRFVNNYDFPIYIDAYCQNENIYISIYGIEERPENRKVTYESEILSTNDPDTEFTLSSNYQLGVFAETRGKHIGYVAKLWKVVKVDGVETEKTQVNKSTYQASCRKVIIGTGGATADQIAKIKAAIATKDDDYVQSVVTAMVTPAAPPASSKPATPEVEESTPDSETTVPDDNTNQEKPEVNQDEESNQNQDKEETGNNEEANKNEASE